MTSFLTLWNYEEFWHGEAIAKVLEAHEEQAGTTRIAALRQRLPKRQAWKPLTFQLASAITPHLTAVHMTWGAVNEWTTQAAYARLAKLADHPTLTQLLRRIMKQEGRHIDFYATQAKSRLTDSRAAQRVTRWALDHFWGRLEPGWSRIRKLISSGSICLVTRTERPGPSASIDGWTACLGSAD